ncbi:MAG: catalase [Bdellovibrio sp.]
MKIQKLSFKFIAAALALTSISAHAEIAYNPEFEKLLPQEEKLYSDITKGILFLQQEQAKNSQDKKLLRGTHAKGICVQGTMYIEDIKNVYPESVASKLSYGLFSQPGRYSTFVRFANAAGSILPDQEPDVRAVSFSIRDVPENLSNAEHKVDVLMNNYPVFPINDAQVFADLMVAAKDAVTLSKYKAAAALPLDLIVKVGLDRAKAIGHAKDVGEIQKQPLSHSFQKTRFWTTTPFAMGAHQAAKYSLAPCAENEEQDVTKSKDPNILQNELMRAVTKAESPEVCFQLQVQLLDADKMKDKETNKSHTKQEWVENALLEWPEAQAPFYNVGKLYIHKNTDVTPEACDNEKMDPIHHVHPDQKGLGSINRARSSAESASAQKRGAGQ